MANFASQGKILASLSLQGRPGFGSGSSIAVSKVGERIRNCKDMTEIVNEETVKQCRQGLAQAEASILQQGDELPRMPS